MFRGERDSFVQSSLTRMSPLSWNQRTGPQLIVIPDIVIRQPLVFAVGDLLNNTVDDLRQAFVYTMLQEISTLR